MVLAGISFVSHAQTDSLLKKVDSARKFLATTDVVYPYIDTPPLYEGGNEKWMQYIFGSPILKNAVKKAKEQNAPLGKHTVIVKFAVDDQGKVSDVHTINKPIGYGLEEAAVKLVESSGKWIPANVEGKNTKAYLNLPIHFTISDGTEIKDNRKFRE